MNKSPTSYIFSGVSQSPLQELQLADSAGGVAYDLSPDFPHTRNRFIHWRTSGDLLDLTETSLDHDLKGGRVQYRFLGSPILANGVSVHETHGAVVVLVATVGSVHRLTFPHPRKVLRQHKHLLASRDDGLPSVFAEATAAHAKEQFHVLAPSGTSRAYHFLT